MFTQDQFNGWMAQKYNVLGMHGEADLMRGQAAGTQAASDALRAGAEAGLHQAQTAQVAPNAEAQRGLWGAQAGEAKALGGMYGRQYQPGPPGWGASVFPNPNPGASNGATIGTPTTSSPLMFGIGQYSHGATSVPSTHEERLHLHSMLMAAQGADQVPGQGDGTVDTVPAVLAPGEAVLNKHAAEMLGRDKIATLNAMGNAQMKAQGGGMPKGKVQHHAKGTASVERLDYTNGQGWKGVGRDWQVGSQPVLDPPLNQRYVAPDYLPPSDTRGYAKGTSKVPRPKPQKLAGGSHHVAPGKSAKTPSKVDPQAILGLLGALRGGGAPQGGGMV